MEIETYENTLAILIGQPAGGMKERLMILDGSSLMFRAFYALPLLTSPQGEYTNAVHGFSNMLVKLLKERHNQEVTTTTIYRVVNQWANENKGVFSDESFASQWGAIRAIATQERDFARLKEALLGTRKEHPGFLMHGVAETKWKERRRRFLLERFLEERHRDVPGYEWLATVNLSSIMAKLAKKK